MRVVEPGYEIMTEINGTDVLKHIERCGRICYKSEDKITEDSAIKFVRMLVERGHEAMIEHFSFSVKFICDRGVSHEIVRHRLGSYAQESTRYCNYTKEKFGSEIVVIDPSAVIDDLDSQNQWEVAMENAETSYFALLENGCSPQAARSVLPNSLKTEIVMTANLREWRHFFKLRTAKAAHPQMREITVPLLKELQGMIPVIFDDITVD